jgi:L-lactate dehydrogenase complex protein LldE
VPEGAKPRVGLFVTCLVDLYRPSIGFASIRLLEQAGCQVEVPRAQTCCGQPAYNSGDRVTARDLAAGILDAFGGYDYVVAPSGSCAGMLKTHLPHLFDDDPESRARADRLAERTFELTSFLVDVRGFVPPLRAGQPGTFTYHDGCSGLRELGVKSQPRKLLEAAGVTVTEMTEPEICCGFGGTFCVKYPEISGRMVTDKVRDIDATRATTVLAGDLGCLLNIAGRLRREAVRVDARHVVEVLVDLGTDLPPIGGVA